MYLIIFRKIIFDNFGLDPVKYISAPSLSKDAGLKFSKCKIENIKNVSIFQFVRKICIWVDYQIRLILF